MLYSVGWIQLINWPQFCGQKTNNIKLCKVMDLVNPNFAFTHPRIICARGWLMLLCTQEYCSSIKSGVKSESHLPSMLCCDFSLLCCGKTEWVTDSNTDSTSILFFFFLSTRKAHVFEENQRNLHTTKRLVTNLCTWVPANPETAPGWESTVIHPLCAELFLQASTSHLFQLHGALSGEV